MNRDHERIARERAHPALVRLHRKLERLSSTLTVMNTGAHPDDEANGMLAALRFGYGMRVVVACSTRGEGGQNTVGSERGAALGILRTHEMEVAARVLDADIAWLGHGPDDPVHDFGFSKNGDDTLARWGADRIVERLVRAYREYRPDIVIATFLDVPGQHGHHRAMTRAAETALDRAADPTAYPHLLDAGLKPWRVSKFYLPAWSGGGSTYDDERPPPPATLTVRALGHDKATGAPFARIGQWSRVAHLSQNMGVWLENPPTSWPLHRTHRDSSTILHELDIRDGLPANLSALAGQSEMPPSLATLLRAAQDAVEQAQAAFPHPDSVIAAAVRAAHSVEQALKACDPTLKDRIGHRLERKLRELDDVILEAGGVHARAWAEPAVTSPGKHSSIYVALPQGPLNAAASLITRTGISEVSRSEQGTRVQIDLSIAPDAAFTTAYPTCYDALGGNGDVSVRVEATIAGRAAWMMVDLEEPLRIEPHHALTLDRDSVILNPAGAKKPFAVTAHIDGPSPAGALGFDSPPGWRVDGTGTSFLVHPPDDLQDGLYVLAPTLNGDVAYRSVPIEYPHIGRAAYLRPERLRVLALDLTLPSDTWIGYVGSGHDHIGSWLRRLGFDVTDLDPATVLQGELSPFTTLVIGVFAFGGRPDLLAARARLHAWTEAGGHLVTFYHRPSDGWAPEETPPRPLAIGSPSVRWRVTDPAAPVTLLRPKHPLLTRPNPIEADDWANWHKERGLYFASQWDRAYEPLLSLHDPGETPLLGALISGRIGKGRHTHVSLALHHQLDHLVPGAFRLLANLVQPA